MASSSSLSCSWLYDVFVSFRGADVRKGFLTHVLKGLESKGIIAFVDDEMKRAGYDFSNCGNEADLINKVALDVTAVLGFTPSKDFDDFVGIGAHITEIKSKLILQSEEFKVIVVSGPAGIGKTTTARVLYNQLSPGFPFSTFLENIRGSYEKPCGNDYQLKLRLQENLLSEIFNQKDIEVRHLGVAQQRLSDKKVLVVLDEVDSWWQLEEMANKHGWFGPGSMLIITTEDRRLLKKLRLGIDHIYEMKFPTRKESLQIFCKYAFGQKSPDYGFESLARVVTGLAGDLPLGLKGTETVLGIYLLTSKGEEIQTSKSAFDGMNNLQFLYVSSRNALCMPESLNCLPNKLRLIHWNDCPLRFWPSKFSGKFLVEVIMTKNKLEKLWEGIQPLQCLKRMDLSSSQYLKEIPDLSKATSLEELDLSECKSLLELTSSIGNATKLRVCKLNGCFLLKELPSSIDRLINLEELYLNSCSRIKDFPDVSDSIVVLALGETGIEEVPPWIEKQFRLRTLSMLGCKKLKTISPNISKLENLEFLGVSNVDISNHEDIYEYGTDLYGVTIGWGLDFKRLWKFQSDFYTHSTFPLCLPEKALRSPISFHFESGGLDSIPYCIEHLSGLSKLTVRDCVRLDSLPRLPGSVLSIDAHGCESLKRINSSFQNPNICLHFANCFSLNQEARNLIQTSACKYAFLPGQEVPAHFPHQSTTSRSLTINMTPTPITSPFRFKACILLSYDEEADNLSYEDLDGYEDGMGRDSVISCHVRGEQNGHTVHYVSDLPHMPNGFLYRPRNHIYLFEDSFSVNQDFPEVEETTFSELSFVFIVFCKVWKVGGCGVRLLEEVPLCIPDVNVDDD
ncbi:hypothetical protein F2Q69_00018999 [Brassica cretica]|uniref:ADP-ribosyl cyclase/cyclic ADP-ribose hydrolase n=1 Tax=Brassica cretica TaxID=69181 RepID=A0A8S9QM32_BRACR|nr:hypothetical protein F2Q69_00018999 [Brassica cretica]